MAFFLPGSSPVGELLDQYSLFRKLGLVDNPLAGRRDFIGSLKRITRLIVLAAILVVAGGIMIAVSGEEGRVPCFEAQSA
ncbi:hypothetical protein ACFLQ0_03240 [Nitrospinota bacterium]